jgi:hypothetical protein
MTSQQVDKEAQHREKQYGADLGHCFRDRLVA